MAESIPPERKLAAVSHLLHHRHHGHFMVWNLSEVPYENNAAEILFDNQVLTYSFPGSPSPPLGLWLKLMVAMENWLTADPKNVIVVHCLTGKGRTSLVVAAFLCWMGEAGFGDSMTAALAYIAQCKQQGQKNNMTVDELTIPSQRRYASYFSNMLDGVRPSQPPVTLQRILLSHAPRMSERVDPGTGRIVTGCVPYLQLFKAGELLCTTTPSSDSTQRTASEVPFCTSGTLRFDIDLVIQGDVLIRARHLETKRNRVSMFRIAFHTGYAPPTVMRLTKSQLDGACDHGGETDVFPDDFFVDLIFATATDKETTATTTEEQNAVVTTPASTAPAAIRASPDDTMLHRDSRFWTVIAERSTAQKKDATEDTATEGPTVGRRRTFQKDSGNGEADGDGAAAESMEDPTFHIGGIEAPPEQQPPPAVDFAPTIAPIPEKPSASEPDSLMAALMGALDDVGGGGSDNDAADAKDEDDTELIVFDGNDEGGDEQASSDAGSAVVVTPPKKEEGDGDDVVDDMEALLLGGVDDDLLQLDDPELDDLESFLSS